MIVRCYKCGKEFSVREGVRSDICPACMSFIDIKKALAEMNGGATHANLTAEKSEELCAAENDPKTKKVAQAAVDIRKKTGQHKSEISALAERSAKSEMEKERTADEDSVSSGQKLTARILPVVIKGRTEEKTVPKPEKENAFAVCETPDVQKEKTESKENTKRAETDFCGSGRVDAKKEATYEERLSQAEISLRENRFSEAREAFEACLKERDDWRAEFGIVLSVTRGLYDLSLFSEVSENASRALDKMPQEAKEKLGEHYVPQLQRMREDTKRGLEALKDERAEEEMGKTKKKSALVFPFAVIVIIAVFFGNIVINEEFGSAEMVFSLYGPILIMLVIVAVVAIVVSLARYSAKNRKLEKESLLKRRKREAECKRLEDILFVINYLCWQLQG